MTNKIKISLSFLLAYSISFLTFFSIKATFEYSYFSIIAFALLILLFTLYKWSYYLIVWPLLIGYVLYIPIGMNYGIPNFNMAIAVATTNPQESLEFFSTISFTGVFLSIAIICLVLVLSILLKSLPKSRKYICYLAILTFPTLYLYPSPIYLYQETFNRFKEVTKEYEDLAKYTQEDHWAEIESVSNKYDTYILVIGESARRDYHNGYGYPVENTPFMSSSNGILIDGLKSSAGGSVESLTRMLTLTSDNGDKDYSRTIIKLLSKAGFKTYWLSNSGHLGYGDTPISAIANGSDDVFYLKIGDYNYTNTHDNELLPRFKEILQNNVQKKQKKFIVLHLIGSHFDSCKRLGDKKVLLDGIVERFANINCYITSIYNTDNLLEHIYSELLGNYEKFEESFSLIYFADHGLAHLENDKKIQITNTGKDSSLYHYDVPLFKVSSDDDKRLECTSFKSGFNFTKGIANWVGIVSKDIDTNYSLFDCKDDINVNQIYKDILKKGIDDPAINLLDTQSQK